MSNGGGMLTKEHVEGFRKILLNSKTAGIRILGSENERFVNLLCDAALRSLPTEGMPPEPKRYEDTGDRRRIVEHPDGRYVRAIDYDTLRAHASGLAADAGRYRLVKMRMTVRDRGYEGGQWLEFDELAYPSEWLGQKSDEEIIDAAIDAAREQGAEGGR